MVSIAELSIRVDSQGVDEASKKLDNLAKSGENTGKALSNVNEPVSDLKKGLSELSKQSTDVLDDKSIKAFGHSVSSVRSSTDDAVKGVRELTQASNLLRESEEQAASRIKNMVAASLARKDASLEAAEAMRKAARASQEEIAGWNDRSKAQTAAMSNYHNVTKATDGLGVSQKELANSMARSQKEFDNLLKKIDPASLAVKNLEIEMDKLQKYFNEGRITQSQFQKGMANLEAECIKLETGLGFFSNTTKTTRRNVLQLLNALKSGNWRVASNNIAELGISSKMSATRLMAIATPIGLAATAIGTLGYAYIRAERENSEFNKAIYLTGNYAGTSLKNLNKMAESIRGVGGNQKTVVTALAEATKTGKFTEDQLKNVATAAMQMNTAFNIPISETISKFEELGDSPTRSIIKLNDQYHFLTDSVYDQIRALEQQGDKAGATNLAIEEFSRSQQEAAQKAINSAGYLERAWMSVTGSINDATSALINFGKVDMSVDAEIVRQRVKINQLERDLTKAELDRSGKDWGSGRQRAQKEIDRLKGELSTAKKELNVLEGKKEYVDSGKPQKDRDYLDRKIKIESIRDQLATPAEKKQKELNDWTELIKKQVLADLEKPLAKRDASLKGVTINSNGKVSGGIYDSGVAQINDKYKNSAGIKQKSYKEDHAERSLAALKEQEAVLRGQLASTEKLSSSQQQLIKFEQQIADIKEKKTLTADQKSILLREKEYRTQYTVNAALEKEIKLRDELTSQKQWQNALNDELKAKEAEVRLNTATVWMSDREAQQYREVIKVQQEYAKQKLALARNQETERALTKETYEQRIQDLDQAMAKEVDIVKKGQQQKRQAEENWLHGANSSYQDYLEEARNVAQQTKGLFTNAFSGMEDALVKFVRTGKLSFSDFANAVLDDLARIGVRMATSSALQAVFGSALGGLFGNYSGASSQLDGLMSSSNGLFGFAKGGAFSGGVQAFAKGDTFTNSIVSTPTPFQFARGGVPSLGVMGEAGDEAIMPLTRTSSGDLGVRAIIDRLGTQGATSSATNVQVYVTIDGQGNAQATANPSTNNGQELARSFEALMRQWVQKERGQGGDLDPNNRRN